MFFCGTLVVPAVSLVDANKQRERERCLLKIGECFFFCCSSRLMHSAYADDLIVYYVLYTASDAGIGGLIAKHCL